MKMRYLLCLFVFVFAVSYTAHAKKRSKKKHEVYLDMVEAYSQRTIPGIRRASPLPAVLHFIIVWEGPQYPDAFFWRADTGLLACNIAKAHKMINNKPRLTPPGREYYTQLVAKELIKKGDTLDIVPMPSVNKKDTNGIPVTADTKNSLFFRTGGPEWRSFHIDTIIKKRDITMP